MNTQDKYKKYVNTACVKSVEPVVIVDAKGAKITAEDGKSYTDLFAGISVVNSGHWMAQEKPVQVNAALAKWLSAQLPALWPPA